MVYSKTGKNIKTKILNKLCSKFEVDISKNELSVIYTYTVCVYIYICIVKF